MKRPKVTLENYEAVYNFYSQYKPNPILNRIGHAGMALAFRPKIEVEPGANERIRQLLANNTRLIIPSNHLTDDDQYVIASMAQHNKAMHPLRGNTFIPAKEPIFNRNLALRYGIDTMGAVPTFRKKDVATSGSDSANDLQSRSTKRLIELSIALIEKGQNMAIFPEGTRNDKQPEIVQPLKNGIGEIACGVSREISVAYLPIGISYGRGDNTHRFTPGLFIGHPIEDRFDSPQELTTQLQVVMQDCVDGAITQLLR